MSKIHKAIVKSISQLTKNIKINKEIIQINTYVVVKRLDKNTIQTHAKQIKINMEDILRVNTVFVIFYSLLNILKRMDMMYPIMVMHYMKEHLKYIYMDYK